jgi:hypothetical protein
VQWWFFSGHAEPAAPAQAQAALAPVKPAAVEKPVEEKSPPPEKPAADKPVEPPPSPAPPEQPPSRLSDVQASRLAGYSAGRQKLLGERLATRSSSSIPTIPTRRAWSASSCARASSCGWRTWS